MEAAALTSVSLTRVRSITQLCGCTCTLPSSSLVNAKLSAAGFAEKADGEGFVGVSAATYTALLSAGDDDLAAMVADLHPPQAEGKQTPPAALLSDTKPPAEQDAPDGVKLSVATSKGSFGGQYV